MNRDRVLDTYNGYIDGMKMNLMIEMLNDSVTLSLLLIRSLIACCFRVNVLTMIQLITNDFYLL